MSEKKLKARLVHAYKTESEWNSSNPVLKEGETGYVSDANTPNYGRYKIGDGSTAWNNLPWGDKVINEKINGIEIGGRNLAIETNQGTYRWGWMTQNSGTVTMEEVQENSIRCCKFTRTSTDVGGWSVIYYNIDNRSKYEAGKTYTVSFEVKASVNTFFHCNLMLGDGTDGLAYSVSHVQPNASANTWKKCVFVLTLKDILPTSTGQVLYLSGMNSNAGVSYVFRNLMIEKGNKATDWSPAPEDKADVSHTHSASDITSGTLSTSLLPTVPVSKGGTGLTSIASGQVLVGNGTGNIVTRIIDTTTGGTLGSTSLITSGAVYSGLAGKANTHSHPYLKLDGSSQMTGDLKFAGVPSLYWNDGTWQQRIAITDDSTADTAVFSFQQSSNSGSNFTDLMVIRDNGKVIANTFVGALSGNANTATNISSQTPTLAVSNESNEITVKINANGSLGDGFLALRNALDFKWYGTHWQIGNLRGSSTDSVGFGFAYSADGTTYILKSRIDLNGNYIGNSSTASKLHTARTIALSGSVTGSASFDGSGNITISTSTNHSHSYAGSPSAGGAAYKNYIPRVSKSCSYQPGTNIGIWEEFASDSDSLPTRSWYHIFTGQGADSGYNTQLALGMTTTNIAYRNRNSGTWGSWNTILTSSNYSSYALPLSGGTMTGKIVVKADNGLGIQIGSSYITAANSSNGEIVLQGGHLRFGESAWDYSQWAGLKYVHSAKTIYLGLADGNSFGTNQAQSGGTILTPGVSKICVGNNANSNIVLHSGNYYSYTLPKLIGYYGSDTAGTNGWYKVLTVSQSGYSDFSLNLLITHGYGRQASGILHVHTRCDNSTTIRITSLKWMYRYGFNANDVIVTTGSNTWFLYVMNTNEQYGRIQVQVLSKAGTSGDANLSISDNTTKESSTPVGTAATDGAAVSYANSSGTASKVSNSLSINGKSYNGSSAIDAGTIAVAYGGTGSTTAAGARANIGAMGSITANGYEGMARRDGDTSDWIRTTYSGIIPYQSGGSGSGHSSLGTSSWYFSQAYIDNIYGYLNGNISGNASSATKLQTARNIFGKSFNGTADVAGQGTFYGTYTSSANSRFAMSGLQIFENGRVGNTQSDIGYAPTIGFHWSNRIGATLAFNSDGIFYFRKQDGTSRATIDANVNGNASTATTASSANWLNTNYGLTYGASGLQYFNQSTSTTSGANVNANPSNDWYHIIRMNHSNSSGYYVDLATCFHGNAMYYRRIVSGSDQGWVRVLDSSCYSSYALPLSGGTVTGDVTISGTLVLTKTTDLSGTADNGPALIVGGTRTTAHMEFDANEIHAKSDGTTPTTLCLNNDGGAVYVGGQLRVSANSYGSSLPAAGNKGRIFFKVI